MKKLSLTVHSYYETNELDPYNPEIWARESLELLVENMIMGQLVYREFSNEIADAGDVVNTRMPAEFVMKRKGMEADVTVQNARAVNVPVKLNQHLHTSFFLRDRQMATGFKNLVAEFLVPAVQSIARGVDLILSTQSYQFMGNAVGQLGTISSSNVKGYILDARQVAFNNKLPNDRNMIWTGSSEKAALDLDLFTSSEKVGDEGTAMREGSLGRKFGFNNFAAQNQPEITTTTDLVIGAASASAAAGATSLSVDGLSAAITDGTWFTVEGDNIPHKVTGTTGGATPTAIAFTPALVRAVENDAVVTIYDPGKVNLTAGYDAGHELPIVVDDFTLAPQVGQGVSFGTQDHVYGIIEATTTSITLDRPLEASVANDVTVNLLPAGSYNLGFDRGAIALVTRPLEVAPARLGPLCYVANAYGLSMRVTMSYEGRGQGILVTVDLLCGVKTLNTNRGILMYG